MKFKGTGKADTFVGNANVADIFQFTPKTLSSSDTVSGGSGTSVDRLQFTDAGTIAAASFAKVSGIEQIVLANGSNNLTVTDALVGSASGDILRVTGGLGNDVINAAGVSAAAHRIQITAGAGNDTLTGGAGADSFSFTALNLTSRDNVVGGEGSARDKLIFTTSGTITAPALAKVSGIEQIVLANGSNNLTVTNALVGSAYGDILRVTAGSGNDVINAAAVTTQSHRVIISGGVGNDTIIAGNGANTLDGGAGVDSFSFTAANLTASDKVVGGEGSAQDQLILTTSGTITAAALAKVSGIEHIVLANGANNLTVTNALVGSAYGDILRVTGGSGNDVINAAAVTTTPNRVYITAGAGNDTLTGGAGVDSFSFTAANLTASDKVVGGVGSAQDQLILTTSGTITAAALAKVSGIEQIVLANGSNNLTLINTLVGSAYGDILKMTGGSGNDVINATGVTTATNRVQIIAGAGNDTLTGGAGADSFSFTASNLTGSDRTIGGAGSAQDQLIFTTAGRITAAAFAKVSGIEQIVLANGANNLTLTNTLVASAYADILKVTGGSGNDVINAAAVTTAANRVRITAGAGNDTLTGGAGADSFRFTAKDLTGSDKIVGGEGSAQDQLIFTAAGTITAAALAKVSGIEQIVLANGANNLTLTNSLVASAYGDILKVAGGSGNDVINAAGVTNIANRVQITAGAGNDTLTGGAGADSFSFTVANLTGSDRIIGGQGSAQDQLIFTTSGTVAASALAKVSGIEQIVLANGSNNLTVTNALVGSAYGDILKVTGGSGNDVINAAGVTTAANRVQITAGAGNDTIIAGSGADTLDGGAGADTLRFAPVNLTGSDTIIGGEGGAVDQLAFTTAGTIAASAFAKVSGIEQIVLANGSNNLTLTNTLVGSAYGDILNVTGGSGNDVISAAAVTTAANRVQITAGAGNDTLTGGAGADTFRFTVADLTNSDEVLGNVGDRTELVTPRDQIVFTTAGTITAAAFAKVAGIERIVLANGTNQLTVSDALVASADWEWTESDGWGTLVWLLDVVGGSGNDTINAAGVTTDMHALRIIAGAGHDTLTGGAGSDSFSFTTKDLTGNDKIVGGNGWDQLVFTTAGAISASAFANVTGIEQIVLATGNNNLTITDALVGTAHEDMLKVLGGSGNDVINAAALTTAGNRMQITAGAGNDTLTGGAGADSFSFTARDLTANDTVVGGAGSSIDRLVFTTAGTIAASIFGNVSGIDQIVLANGTNNLTLANALVTSAKGMMLDVAGGSGNDVINASNVTATGHRITVSGGEGDDTIFGGAGADILDGGKGSDTLVVTGSAHLIVRLNVDEEVDQTVGDTDIVRNFENFNGSGISVALTITGSGDANRLTGGSSHDIIDGKGGEDIISGGGGDDRIYLREWTLSLNGGSGNDTLVFDAMWGASIDFSAANQSLDDAMSITGFENFDGSGANSSVWIIGSSAANYLVGGGHGDTFVVGAGDTVFGGAGDDTVTVSANGSAPVYLHGGDAAWDRLVLSGGYDFSASTITGFEVLNLKATSKVTFTAAQWGQFEALSIDDPAPVTTLNIVFTEAGTLDVSTSEPNDNNNNYNITGSAGNDTIRGSTLSTSTIRAGEGDDVITLRGGYADGVQDKIYGEAGNDTIELVFGVDEATAPLFDGGTGSDTLTSTRYQAIIDLSLPTGTSQVTTASAYAFVRNFENVDWTGNTHVVRAYGNGGANTLIGGLGNDTLEGRGGDDAIDGGAGNNTIDGGDGQDIITISIVDGVTSIAGGSGSDIFNFAEPNFVAGLTTITDFTDGEDVFRFKYMAYISDGPFVTTDEASLAGEVDISDTDLLRIDGGGVTQDTVKTYLEENSTAADGEGLFVVGRIGGVGSSVHLYFVADAGEPTEVVQVASLGANFNPGTLDGADFQFL